MRKKQKKVKTRNKESLEFSQSPRAVTEYDAEAADAYRRASVEYPKPPTVTTHTSASRLLHAHAWIYTYARSFRGVERER